jgi:hypothetical protein
LALETQRAVFGALIQQLGDNDATAQRRAENGEPAIQETISLAQRIGVSPDDAQTIRRICVSAFYQHREANREAAIANDLIHQPGNANNKELILQRDSLLQQWLTIGDDAVVALSQQLSEDTYKKLTSYLYQYSHTPPPSTPITTLDSRPSVTPMPSPSSANN